MHRISSSSTVDQMPNFHIQLQLVGENVFSLKDELLVCSIYNSN